VGAVDAAGASAPFNPIDGTDAKKPAPWIDVFAPGVEITSTYLGESGDQEILVPTDAKPVTYEKVAFEGYANWSGTSFAAAHVTGLVAARISAGMTPQEAVQAVRQDLPRP
jgi:membrane-anchored mycosin MYCP